jgi:hypothetical protein
LISEWKKYLLLAALSMGMGRVKIVNTVLSSALIAKETSEYFYGYL